MPIERAPTPPIARLPEEWSSAMASFGERAYSAGQVFWWIQERGVMDPAAAHAFFNAPDPLAAFCRDPMLWGALAGNPQLEAAVREADGRVQSFIKG